MSDTETKPQLGELHFADDCDHERCTYCGCCAHGRTQRGGCKVDQAPLGMTCPGRNCGCEGQEVW